MMVKRMGDVGIVVEDIDAAIELFIEPGLILEGRMPIEKPIKILLPNGGICREETNR